VQARARVDDHWGHKFRLDHVSKHLSFGLQYLGLVSIFYYFFLNILIYNTEYIKNTIELVTNQMVFIFKNQFPTK
jgi:hypothetical protein